MGGTMLSDLTGPQLRNVLRAVSSGEMRKLPSVADSTDESEAGDESSSPTDRARARWGGGDR
jgi:hypothetical protein